jgi:hypothetical protein
MAQRRAGTGSEDGGHPTPMSRQDWMADGVDAAVDSVQASRGRTMRHRALREPEPHELRECDDTMLALRQPRDLPVHTPNDDFQT